MAVFLLVRGPYAWLGYGWVGTDADYYRPPALDIDYGEPVDALCREAAPGVFQREWSRASVAMGEAARRARTDRSSGDNVAHACAGKGEGGAKLGAQ